MGEIPKRIRRLLREYAAAAHEEELRRALAVLRADFDRWERGEIGSGELSDLIHKFHQGPSRDLFVRYNSDDLELPVAYAAVSGILDRNKMPPELLEYLGRAIAFYEARRAPS